jgi:5-methylcytosine-specific restriction endonuclease McrBC regulatory subunit McrC
MNTSSVFEHSPIATLSNAEKNLLDQLRGPHNERVFEVGWRQTRATSFVGVVQLPHTALQVLPKMYRHENDKEREATANLLFMLSYTRKLDVTEPEISRLTAQRAPFSEILFWVFAHRLWDAVHREVLRGYVTIEERLDVLKGRWLVATQAGRPDGWRRDRFDVAYDEFTEDNLPNRLFKATVHRLCRWSQRTDTRRYLTQLRAVFADVADVTPQPHDFYEAGNWMERYRRRIGERHLYRPLLDLARMFWTDTGPQPSPGRTETFAFLFDPPNRTADKHEPTLRGVYPPFCLADSSPSLSAEARRSAKADSSAANCAKSGNRAAGHSTPKAAPGISSATKPATTVSNSSPTSVSRPPPAKPR